MSTYNEQMELASNIMVSHDKVLKQLGMVYSGRIHNRQPRGNTMSKSNQVRLTVKIHNNEPFTGTLAEVLEHAEKEIYELGIQGCRYNQSRFAREMGLSRGSIRAKLRQWFGLKYIGARDE